MVNQLLLGLRLYPSLKLEAVLLSEGRLAAELRKHDISVHLLDEKMNSFPRLLYRLNKIISRVSPAVIHSHRYKENILASLASLRFPHIKLVSTQHGMPESGQSAATRHRAVRRVDDYFLRKVFDKVITVSQDMRRRYIVERGYSDSKMVAIHNGIQMPMRRSVTYGGRPFRFGSCGRFSPVKDYPLIVEVARQLIGGKRNIEFVLVGDGPEMDRIRGLVQKYHLGDAFILPGYSDDMPAFYRSIDVFVNTSLHEGIPMSILEAMAFRLPVVAADVGGIPEIIDDHVDGFLVRSRDARSYAAICERLYHDEQLRETISDRAEKKIQREFSFGVMASKYHRLYHEICERG